jgi:hypothetical protein
MNNGPPGPSAKTSSLSGKLRKKAWTNDSPKALDISDAITVKQENLNYIKLDRKLLKHATSEHFYLVTYSYETHINSDSIRELLKTINTNQI